MNPHTEIIEKYLSGELDSLEKEKFEQSLQTDLILKDELEIQKLILKGIERHGLKNEINTSFKNARRRWRLIRRGGIGGILLFAGLTFFLLWQSSVKVTKKENTSEITFSTTRKHSESKTETKKDSIITVLNKFIKAKKIIPQQKSKTYVSLKDSLTSKTIKDEAFKIPSAFLVPQSVFKINPLRDTILVLTKKGTKLHIPKLSFVDGKGQQVKDIIDITYREYTNAAEMAFSEIPMTYKKEGIEYNFNSSGMFELEGSSKGEKVEIDPAKSVQIDYALARQNPNIDFYYLNKNTGAWEMKEEIKEIVKESLEPETLASEVTNNSITQERDFPDFSTLNEKNKAPYIKILKEKGIWPKNDKEYKKVVKKLGENWQNKLLEENIELFVEANLPFNENKKINSDKKGVVVKKDKLSTLLGGGDLGHTYPPIIRGLNVDGFGVYNCDQIYRIGNFVSIKPKFEDKDGNQIKNLYVLSLIDLKYNGAFSFDPRNFNCNAKSDNVLMLFTKNGKLYSLNNEEFKAMNITTGGNFSFKMTEVTDKIKSTEDLKNYLGLK